MECGFIREVVWIDKFHCIRTEIIAELEVTNFLLPDEMIFCMEEFSSGWSPSAVEGGAKERSKEENRNAGVSLKKKKFKLFIIQLFLFIDLCGFEYCLFFPDN